MIIEMIIGITIVIPVVDECLVFGIMLSISHLLFHFFPYNNTGMLHYLHFTDRESKSWRRKVTIYESYNTLEFLFYCLLKES